VTVGYYEARQLEFLATRPLRVLEWLRLPGDAVFIVGGVVPLVLLCWRAVRAAPRALPAAGAPSPLFTDAEDPGGSPAGAPAPGGAERP
jgi:nitric oxide reductase subunit B